MKGTVYMDKSKIRQLADYAIRQCSDNSENCYWSVSYDELYYHFGAEVTDTNENGRLLEEELRQREEINELIMTEDCIEMTCHLQYCHNCQGNPVSLLSVLGCNIYDEHETEHHHTYPARACTESNAISKQKRYRRLPDAVYGGRKPFAPSSRTRNTRAMPL